MDAIRKPSTAKENVEFDLYANSMRTRDQQVMTHTSNSE